MSVGTATGDLRRRRSPAPAVRAALADPAVTAVAAMTVLGAVLRLYRLGHQGFWFDEGNTALLVHFPPGKMLGLIPQTESTPPLYYCVAWLWARVFGYDEVGLRSLSAVCGVLLVPVVYAAGARLISRRAGVIAAGLAACSPLLIWYSQEARSYSMLALLSSVSLLAFAYARFEPTPRVLAAWVVASALALATHYYALLAVVPEALWLLWVHRRRRSVQVAVGVVGVCGLGLIPLAISQHGTGRGNWISSAPFGRRLGQIVPQFASGFDGPAHAVFEPVAIAMVVLALVLLFTRSLPEPRRGALVAGGLAVAGFVLSLLLVAVRFDDLLTRNMLAIWAACALLVAGGLAAPRPRGVGVIAAVVLCVMGLATAIGVAVDRSYERPDWRVVAGALGRAPAGGRAILVQHYRDLLPLSLYVPGLRFARGAGVGAVPVREFDVVSFTSPSGSGFCWWGSACNLWPSRAQSSYPIAGFHLVSERHALQFTILRMVSSRPVRLTPAAVAGVLTATHFANDELLLQRP
ncbi:MAG TPA: glycosyltransferase family 39 protein [Solirubrobacteraceae bacterium]|nr:glycosyltransferase family 39 protein [Solirubrobacteraceae bacterium]